MSKCLLARLAFPQSIGFPIVLCAWPKVQYLKCIVLFCYCSIIRIHSTIKNLSRMQINENISFVLLGIGKISNDVLLYYDVLNGYNPTSFDCRSTHQWKIFGCRSKLTVKIFFIYATSWVTFTTLCINSHTTSRWWVSSISIVALLTIFSTRVVGAYL